MAGRVPEHIIRDIVRRADVVRLIDRYTTLQEKGEKYWGLCPFHNEKTPSFSVDAEEGLYYCFGCKEGGNLFTFLEKMEGLEFRESLQQLAEEAGVDLSRFSPQDEESREPAAGNTLRQINELAAVFYHKCLAKARGSETARNYLEKRRIDGDSVEKWRIGYAPEGWEHVVNLAKRRKIDLNTVELAGLVLPRKGDGSYYDRFRNRLVFPVTDRHGGVIGFGARALDEENQKAKYLNSPETPIFNKRRCFYGLDHGRSSIRRTGTAVLVEGYTDVIMAHQCGVENVIAVLGTALTEFHAETLSKLCEKVILLFDADEAGQKSAEKSIQTLLSKDVEPFAARLPEGLDPCDFLLNKGKEAFEECLAESEDFLQFCIRKARRDHDLKQRLERTRVFQRLAEMASVIPNGVKREMLVREIADELGVAPQSAFDHLGRLLRHKRRGDRSNLEEEGRLEMQDAEQKHLSEMLRFLLVNPQYQKQMVDRQVFESEIFADTPQREMLELLLAGCEEKGPVSESDFLYMLEDEDRVKKVRDAVEKERRYAAGDGEKRLRAYIDYIEKKKKRARHEPGKHEDESIERLKNYVEMRRNEDR